jgi:hypothetical protein
MGRYLGLLSSDSYSVPLDEMRLAHIQYTAEQAVAADTDGLLDGDALTTSAKTFTDFLNDMPYARNITAVCSDTQTGDLVVNGTNIDDEVISETIALDSATPVAGAVAFKTATSIVTPAKAGSETIDVGWGELIGLPVKLSAKPLVFALDDGAIMTAPVVTADEDELEKNVINLDGSLDGSVYDVFFAI